MRRRVRSHRHRSRAHARPALVIAGIAIFVLGLGALGGAIVLAVEAHMSPAAVILGGVGGALLVVGGVALAEGLPL